MNKWLLFIVFFIVISFKLFPQGVLCPEAVPVNLTSSPSAVFTSMLLPIGPILDQNKCCPNSPTNQKCIRFSITLNPGSMGIRFEMNPASSSNLFWMDCGAPIVVGSFVCLTGPGPHVLTYCDQSSTAALFKITSIPRPGAGPNISISQGCSKTVSATGFVSQSANWNSIYPGNPGSYNNYLSCPSGCSNPTISGPSGAPPYVDYQICGNPVTPGCGPLCDTIRVFFTSPLAVTVSPPNPTICNGQVPNSTTFSAVGSGGSGTYTYLWNNINTSQTITGPNGLYTVLLSDGSGCTATTTVQVTTYSVPVSASAGPDQTVCYQIPATTLNGSVTGASGGTWLGGGGLFSPNASALNATYTPSVLELGAGFVNLILKTTGNGTCAPAYDTVKIKYELFTGVVGASVSLVSCYGGSDGGITVSVVGGVPPYTYAWNTSPAQTAATATGLGIGNYSVTVTNSIGCTSTTSATVIQPPQIALAFTNITHVSCAGGNNGSLSVNASGGIGPYTYLWSNGAVSAQISNLTSQTYSVTVKDSKGCEKTSSYTINEPPAISIGFTLTPVTCFGGSTGAAISTVSGGTSPYTYNWSFGGSSPNASGLTAGTYTLTVSDVLGCSKSNTILITQPAPMVVSTSVTNETCSYLNNGSANAVASGGNPGYSFLWQPGAQTSMNISNLSSGTYTLTTTDSINCSVTVFATVAEPAFFAINFISQVNVSCFGGSNGMVTASPTGGTSPYTYLWAGGATTPQISNLSSQTYTVTVVDQKGCTVTNPVIITEPLAPLAIIPAVTNVSCNGGNNGAIAITPSGGTGPYTYLWSNGATASQISNLVAQNYSVIVKDAKLCQVTGSYVINQPLAGIVTVTPTHVSCANGSDGSANVVVSGGTAPYTYSWSSGANTPQVSNLSAQSYTLTVTDALGCSTIKSGSINQPLPVVLNPVITHIVCSGGSSGVISLTPTGGIAPYTYLWSQGNQTTSSISSLSIGTYTVTVTDSNACQKTIAYTVNQLSLSIAMTPTHIKCFGGSNGTISALPSGGTPNFSYSWMPGGATTNALSNLPAGTYTLSVTDFKGCIAANSVTLTQPSAVSAGSTSTNETCNYLNNGTATAIPSGGKPGYTYLWQPALQTTAMVTGLSAGTYTLTVTDSAGCSAITTTVITQPAPVTINFSGQINITTCFGDNIGAVSGLTSGGTPTYTYSWVPGGATTNTISNLLAGKYTLTTLDSNGCTATNSVTITQPSVVKVSTSKNNETCSYLNNGTATAQAFGGSPGYTFLWQPGSLTGNLISGLSAGTYTVTATDAQGCTANAQAVIAEPAVLAVTYASQVNVSCSGGNNGTVSTIPSGGTANYIYSWAPGGATTASGNSLTAGTHTTTITDAKGCIASNTITITEPAILLAVTISANETCSYSNDGTATAVPTGGTSPYTYLWKPGLQTTPTLTNLSAGTYTLIVTDAKNCAATSTTIISQPDLLAINFSAQVNVSTCFGDNNGSVTANPVGGTPDYAYAWMPGSATTSAIANLTQGTYTLNLTDSAGCIATNTVIITEPELLTASAITTDESCNYLNDGTAIITGSGGIPGTGYTYLWQPGSLTSNSLSGLTAGTYTVTVTDSKACTATINPVIAEPATLAVNFTGQINVSCFGGNDGTVSTVPSGGTPNYTYSWAPGGATNANRSNLAAGTHTLTITDSRGCSATNSVFITQPAVLSATTTITNETCSYSNNGTATAVPSGGTAGYTYTWQPGFQTTITITALAAGTYTVTVKDTKGCTTTALAVITQPPVLAINFTSQINVSCKGGNDGSVTASPTGGTPGYTYLWTPGGATTTGRSGLIAGNYTVKVTDSRGCTVTKVVKILEPTVLLVSTSKTNETCSYLNDGTATAIASGGNSGYTYLWQPGALTGSAVSGLSAGTYTLTTTDSKLCSATAIVIITEPDPVTIGFSAIKNASCFGGSDGAVAANVTGGTLNYAYLWSPGGANSNSISNISAGTYSVTVTDSEGCSSVNSVVIAEPLPLIISSSSVSPTCFNKSDGSISASASGGTLPYNYAWITPIPTLVTGSTVSNTQAGIHSVTVGDGNGCYTTDSFTVTEPDQIIPTITTVNSGCDTATGSATVVVSGGIAPYTYLWSTGSTDSMTINLAADVYTVIVTDANGCAQKQFTDVIDDSAALATITVTEPSCFGGSDGTATVSTVGGSGTFSYLWLPSGGTGTTATGLSTGIFTVKVTTMPNNCKSSATDSLSEPSPILLLTYKNKNVSCNGGNDGNASAITLGGTPGYTYLWSPGGETNSSAVNFPAATYTVVATDSQGCKDTANVYMYQPLSPIVVSISSFIPVSCFGESDGEASSTAATGENGGAYQYKWMPGNINGQNASTLPADTYTLTVTDYKGCFGKDSVIITEPPLLTFGFINQINVSCFGGTDGSIASTLLGGTPGYAYLWQPGGATTTSISNLKAGKDTLTITDFNGCIVTNIVTIVQPTVLSPTTSKTNETCNYLNDGTAGVVASGATPPYNYLWQPGALTTNTLSGLSAGTYSITVTDSLGCIKNETMDVTEPTLLGITFSDQINVSCFAGNNGSISATTSGGTLNYNYSWVPGGSALGSLINITEGTYTVTVTDTNSCLAQNEVTITQPPSALSDSVSSTHASCSGGSDGSVFCIASGGTGPYNYKWMPGNLNGSAQVSLSSGTYTVTITDSKGCTVIDSVVINQPTSIVLTSSTMNSNCSFANGQASVSASGGTGSYLYLWAPSGGTDATATGLFFGSYSVSVTDSNSCVSTEAITVNDNPSPGAVIGVTTNVSCFGGSDGATAVNVIGIASGPFSYSWQPSGGTNSTASGLLPGTYTVTVTDANNCVALPVVSPEITQPSPIFITIDKTATSCFGDSNGSATAIGSGGTPGYTYLWLPGGTTGTSISNLSAITYTVQVTDMNSCIQSTPFTIGGPPAALSTAMTSTPVLCYGGADGSASSTASGGTGPYDYNWMPGNYNAQNLYNLTSGTYTVTVTDSKGCIHVDSIAVDQPSPVVLSTDSTNSSCSLANGQATVSVSGGIAPYLYLWAPTGETNATTTALLAGTYTLSVTDSNSCISTVLITVNDNPTPVATISATTDVSCFGAADGTVTVTATGTTQPFTYAWSPSGGTNSTATNLVPGTYTVTVTDTNMCQSLPVVSPEVTEPSPILIQLAKDAVSCFGGGDGSAIAVASGGIPGYSYLWLPGGITGTNITNLSANTYTVQVTDANSCVKNTPFTITEPPSAVSVSLVSLPVSCFGEADGSITTAVAGGTAPYNYFWMPGNVNGQNLSNLAVGTFTVTIVDSKGCSLIDSSTVTQPDLIVLSVSSINSRCSMPNGQASVTVAGGTAPYLYEWLPSGQTNAIATALLSGTHTITVTDSNSCVSTTTVVVNDSPSPVATVNSITHVTCNGGSDGTATATFTGASGPFTYLWQPAGGTNLIATGLLPGTYTITVTDSNSCQSLPAISAEITEPDSISIAVTTSTMSCFGGNNETASAIATGGVPGYTYQWLPGGTTGPNVTNLSANTYTIEVTDASSCLQTKTFAITEPDEMIVAFSAITNVSCFGGNNGTATVNVSEGTPVYNYNWMPSGGNGPTGTGMLAGTYTITITDNSGCTISDSVIITQPLQELSATSTKNAISCFGVVDGTASIFPAGGTPGYSYQWNPSVSTSDTAFGLGVGIYNVIVTDTNSCQTNLSVSISQPAVLSGTLVSINPSCNLSNGSITPQLSGGTYPYGYLWSPGGSTTSGVNGLPAGGYNLQITDARNCTISLASVLSVIPEPLIAVSSITDVSCFGGDNGSATINITQGTSPYTVSWLPAGGNSSTGTLLTAGTYTVTIIDAAGCQRSDSVLVVEPLPILVSVDTVMNVLCNGDNTGAIFVSATGGTGSLYTYNWAPISSDSSTAVNLSIGTYTVNVMDQNNCPVAISINVAEPSALSSSMDTIANPMCFNGFGSASVLVTGGILPYNYLWSPSGSVESTATDLKTGPNAVTITDANGCSISDNALLTEPSQVITTAGDIDTLCLGQSGSVSATATGGAGNYYYAWQPSGAITSGTLPITPTSDITYTVIAYDEIGCAGTPATTDAVVYILNSSSVQAFASSPICPGQSAVVYVETYGNTGALTYQWDNNLGTGPGVYTVTPAQPTTFIVTVSNACISVSDTVEILFNPPPAIALTSDTSALCVPGTIQFFDNSVTGNPNDPITQWYWSFGDGTSSTEEDPAHSYTVPVDYPVTLIVTTSGGCTNNNLSAPMLISGHPFPVAAFSVNSTNLNLPFDELQCINQSTGINTYEWDFGNGETSTLTDPQYLYTTIGVFQVQLIAMTDYGCMDTAYAEVTTNADVTFPNAFSPDPDGPSGGYYDINNLDNNIFFAYTSGVVEYKLEIFNRWGEMIFETQEIKQGWDGYLNGQLCPQDVYIWRAFIRSNNGKIVNRNGSLTLLR